MENEKMNAILIGMPGCGKSTCGVLAAKALCKSFVDTDLIIQSREGMPLQEIIDTKGTDYFAETEERILLEADFRNSIIATGGSAVYYDRAMTHLRETGKVIWLRITFDEMMRRITNMKTRGILLRNGESIEEMFALREKLCKKYADAVIDCTGNDIEKTVCEIADLMK